MNLWLMKSEPETFSWDDLVRDGGTEWDGVRNNAATLNLKAMKPGDRAFLYHSVSDKAVVGIMEIVREARPDPKAKPGERWASVRVEPVEKLARPVTLAEIKAELAARQGVEAGIGTLWRFFKRRRITRKKRRRTPASRTVQTS